MQYTTNNKSLVDACGTLDSKYETIGDGVFHMSAMKIFTAMVLYIWRQREKELNILKQSVISLKNDLNRCRNQLEFYHSQVREKEKQNRNLSCQLNNTMEILHETKSSCNELSDIVTDLKADKRRLEYELQKMYEDYNTLHEMLIDTRKTLFQTMLEQHSLLSEISQKEHLVKTLENHANLLRIQLTNLTQENTETNHRLIELRSPFDNFQLKRNQFMDIQNSQPMNESYDRGECWRKHINIGTTWHANLLTLWNRFAKYRHSTVRYIHILAFYLLPAIPTPGKFICE
ncbi:uncharacterized protein [Musca autumnalis]|uniref:uncharacterized protein n=1 Tax=Musca autumnalis TaxID=221902 RepID=UPI003CF40D38